MQVRVSTVTAGRDGSDVGEAVLTRLWTTRQYNANYVLFKTTLRRVTLAHFQMLVRAIMRKHNSRKNRGHGERWQCDMSVRGSDHPGHDNLNMHVCAARARRACAAREA